MKRVLLLLCLTLTCLAAGARQRRVLWVGNSYTEVNNLPQMTALIADSRGDTLLFEAVTPGGCTLQQHCSGLAMEKIRLGGWDAVVLQEQSQLPSFPIGQVEQQVFPFARILVDSIRAYNPGCEPIFYMTWGRRDGDPQNAPYFPPLASYEGMDSLLCARYSQMAADNHASLCPVGQVWHLLRTRHPEIELYAADGSHPSTSGTYAAACAFSVMLFHADPATFAFQPVIDSADAAAIRSAVREVVYEQLSSWSVSLPSQSIAERQALPIRVWPNPTGDWLTIDAPGASTARLLDARGHTVATLRLTGAPVSVDALAAGVYFLVVEGSVRKIVKL